MTLSESMYGLFSGSDALGLLVPASSIKPPGNWQRITLPYIIHFPISENPVHAHGEMAGSRNWSYQASVFASDYPSGENIVHVVRREFGHVITDDGVSVMLESAAYVGREEDTGVHHWPLTFRVVESLGGEGSSPP